MSYNCDICWTEDSDCHYEGCEIRTIRTLQDEVERLRGAIEWACGVTEDGFEKPEDAKGNYWWRNELRKRAGLVYYTYDKEGQTVNKLVTKPTK